jgi:hypothetical protein
LQSIEHEIRKCVCDWVVQCYDQASAWLRMPGHTVSRSFQSSSIRQIDDTHPNFSILSTRCIIDIPPPMRHPSWKREETIRHVHEILNWKPFVNCDHLLQRSIVLVMFGGHQTLGSHWNLESLLPRQQSWAILFVGNEPPSVPNTSNTDTIVLHVPQNNDRVSFPDLVAASDVVLGKIGYGTVGECIAAECVPFVYVPREGFVEEQPLAEWMRRVYEHYYTGIDGVQAMSLNEFESGQWAAGIERALAWKSNRTLERNVSTLETSLNGNQVIAETLYQLVKTIL